MSTTSLPPRLLNGNSVAPSPIARRTRLAALVLIACCGLGTGCASTAPGRRGGGLAANPNAKTIMAVGDKPLPVVTGEPGSTIAADEAEPTAPRKPVRPEGRISGRVYDQDGRPVPNARVRLAVGGSPAGRDIRATTDRSGAFTLRDLRPATDYTVIAEWNGPDGLEVGRARARANRTDLRIGLSAPNDAPATADAGSDLDGESDLPRIKVNRVSERGDDEIDEEETRQPGRMVAPAGSETDPADEPARVNEEDLPPAPEAEALAPPRAVAVDETAADRWRGRGERTAPAPVPAAESRSAPLEREPSNPPIDEGPNPLPPALERPGGDSAAARTGGADPFADVPAPRLAAQGEAGRSTTNRSLPPDDRAEPARRPRSRIAEPDESLPGAFVAVPETFAPVPLGAPPAPPTRTALNQPAGPPPRRDRPEAPPRRTAPKPANPRPAAAPSSTPSDEPDPMGGLPPAIEPGARADAATPVEPDAAVASASLPAPEPAPVEPAPVDTRSVFEAPKPLPPVVSTAPAAPALNPVQEPAPEVVAAAPVPDWAKAGTTLPTSPQPLLPANPPAVAEASSRPRPTWGEVAATAADMPPLEGGAGMDPERPWPPIVAMRDPRAATTAHMAPAAAAAPAAAPKTPACDYDDRHRRLIDFRLPGLDGRTVRFSDLDADLVLLDFWGTWCQPCIKSVPHLVELRSRLAGKKLQIVGIACEPESGEAAARKVKAKADGLRINYPVLLSRNDGSCPVQEALHVQALPTLILLDREGRILWRGEGATPATLARLDHMINSATGNEKVTR